MNPKVRRIFVVFRGAVATFLFIHGVSRLTSHGVSPFGEFLATQHIPLPHVTAWVLTLVEIAGTVALALGFFVLPLSLWFALELALGIVMVHARNGWFVVGGGFNGVEYSVLLITCFLCIAASQHAADESKRLL